MALDWLRLWPEFIRLNLQKARHARRLRSHTADARPLPPAPCQSPSDSGRAHETRCDACLRLDHSARYRFVCPALRLRPDGGFCSLDSRDIRPGWARAALAFAAPPLALASLAALAVWAALRFGGGLDTLRFVDIAWPPYWSRIEQHRRVHFQDLALQALRDEDIPSAKIALFAAAQITSPEPSDNIALARLATLGQLFSLSDEVHVRNLAAHPARAAELAIAWHDDLLIARRPQQLARLALGQLASPAAPREPWLRAFLESISHPGVSADLLAAEPPLALPHPGLRHALAARVALDRGDRLAASDALLAFEGALPGLAARRFLTFSWTAAGDTRRARLAAISVAHPAPPGEIAALAHALLRLDGKTEEARAALRPLFGEPGLRSVLLACLIQYPDAVLVAEFAAALPAEALERADFLGGLWLAARMAGAGETAKLAADQLSRIGKELPAELQAGEGPLSASSLSLAVGILTLDREVLYALRAPR